jgi:hypothetical protein
MKEGNDPSPDRAESNDKQESGKDAKYQRNNHLQDKDNEPVPRLVRTSGEGNTSDRNAQLSHAPKASPDPKYFGTSLEDLQKWPESRTLPNAIIAGASHGSLPLSRASSLVSLDPSKNGILPQGW